ncbi:collagen-like protein [Streptomyces sp. NPDC016845]|uniref:collagen-like protein n=1 Tax=Streptomyces sp. NPDC016845 TaxID=3364972 RepID=UPI0037AFA1AC
MRHKNAGAVRRRSDLLYALVAAAALAGFAFLVVTMQSLSHDLRSANEARDLLARQVQQLGGKPVAGPPGSRGEPGQSVTGPRGPNGSDGVDGTPGSPGPFGAPGRDGTDGASGADGAAGVGSPGPTGAAGTNGEAGPPGPQGEPGPAGPQGPAGANGQEGADGRDGADGTDGTTQCPDGYSWQTPADDPDALICRREGAPPPEQPDPEETPPVAAGLDPTRRQYV